MNTTTDIKVTVQNGEMLVFLVADLCKGSFKSYLEKMKTAGGRYVADRKAWAHKSWDVLESFTDMGWRVEAI
jgi:hypothetical protein